MKKIIFLILTIVSLTACEKKQIQWQVICDSGFKTPVSYYTYMHEGDIRWKVEPKGPIMSRRMMPGEICSDIKTVTIITD